MTQGFAGFFLLLGAGWGCCSSVPYFQMCSSLSANDDENQKIKLNKNQKYPELL